MEGINIGFIGVATPETLTTTKAENVEGLKFLDPTETINKYSPQLRSEGADVIVALTHSGSEVDDDGTVIGEAADIAKNANDIDAVISAHTHEFVDGFVKNNNGKDIPVVQAGKNGKGLSVLTFTFDENKKTIDVKANTRKFSKESDTNEFPKNEAVEQMIEKYKGEVSSELLKKVTTLSFDLPNDKENGLTKIVATVSEALRKATGTQVCILNGGGIRASLSKGDITIGDMYTILPFDNDVVTMKVTGAKLKELIRYGINPNDIGWGQYSGITVWYNPETSEITSMRLADGTKVKDDEYYTLTTIDFLLTGGDGYKFDQYTDLSVAGEIRNMFIDQWSNGV